MIAVLLLTVIEASLGTAQLQGSAVTNNAPSSTDYDVRMAIRVKGKSPDIAGGGSCVLLIQFTNTSLSDTLPLGRRLTVDNDDTYSFKVVSPAGGDVPARTRPGAAPGGPLTLRPGDSLTLEFNLCQRYTLGEPGTYRIVATKRVWWPERQMWFTIVSNELDLKVGKAPPEGGGK